MAALAAEEAAKAQAAQLASTNSNSMMNNGMMQHISRGNFFQVFYSSWVHRPNPEVQINRKPEDQKK